MRHLIAWFDVEKSFVCVGVLRGRGVFNIVSEVFALFSTQRGSGSAEVFSVMLPRGKFFMTMMLNSRSVNWVSFLKTIFIHFDRSSSMHRY